MDPYYLAQHAISDLKSAILLLLKENEKTGLSNAEIGRKLGIYHGHIGHEGHISSTILVMIEADGVVEQDNLKKWILR